MNLNFDDKYVDTYNSALTVEAADDMRNSRLSDFKLMLEEISKSFSNEDSAKLLGLRLIHKHFDLQEGQIVHETSVMDENEKPIFIAKAKPQQEPKQCFPNSWIIRNEDLVPFEYSSDQNSCAFHENHLRFSNDLNMLTKKIQAYGFEQIIGPAINRRTISEATAGGGVYMEQTDYDEIANILKIQSEAPKTNSVETSWGFDPTLAGIACGTWCDSYCYYLSPGHARGHFTGHGPIA